MRKPLTMLFGLASIMAASAAAFSADAERSPGLPAREPMRAAVLYQKPIDGLVVEEVAYLWAERAYVFANVIRPQGVSGRRPAVVIAPGRLGHYNRPPYKDFVYRLAQRGLVVLFIDDPHIGRRNAPEAGLHAVAAAAGVSVPAIRVFDALRGLDYLLTRSDVDSAGIGLVGVGEGAEAARLAARLERRFKFAVPVAGGDAERLDRALASSIEERAHALPASPAQPLACGTPQDPDFSMLRYMQRRIAARPTAGMPASADAWKQQCESLVAWLAEVCKVSAIRSGPSKVVARSKQGSLAIEKLDLPARLFYASASGGNRRPGVILSHDSRQCATTAEITEAASRLATRGYVVILPEHASPDPQSPRLVDEEALGQFHAKADAEGRCPLALRVADDLAAYRYLSSRAEVDPQRIVAAGRGIGALDACLAALLEPRIAGVVSIDATTLRDWAHNVAPEENAYWEILPYLPSLLLKADFDACYAALAPRPLLLAKLKDGWPKSGFQQVATAAGSAYRLLGSPQALVVVSPREVLEQRESRTPEGIGRQLIAVARSILPPPPAPGIVGSPELVKRRPGVDSARGLVWLVHTQGGVEQEFIDGGYRLVTWSFFNDLPAERGRSITPLVFKREGQVYRLTAIGRPRVNTGAGLQTHPFEPIQGSDAVAADHYFGFYTGDPAGSDNAGVVEYDEGRQDRMTVLGLETGAGKVPLGGLYREQASYPRTYSIHAISLRK